MKRDEAFRKLSELKSSLVARFQVSRLGCLRSTARNDATGEGDLGIVVEMPPIGLWAAAGLRDELEQTLGVPVDLVRYRETLNPRLKRRIDSEAVHV